jgi:DNA-binding LacI/PurR family transcriptional regulator
MPATQHEIAKHLGISRGTLYRVLSNSPLVNAATRERVLNEVKRLNYAPNAIARGLKMRCTHTVGVVGPAALKLSNIDKLNALHFAARERGYTMVLGYSDGSADEDARCIRELQSRMVDGFIAFGRGLPLSTPHYQALIDSGKHLVTLYPLPGLEVDCVFVHTREAYRNLTTHLIKLGHRDIALLIDASASQYTLNREEGFRETMTEAGLKPREDWIVRVTPDGISTPGDERREKSLWKISSYQYGFWGTSLLLARRERPTAIVCYSDEFAIGALRAADVAGIEVPRELSIVGYDDQEPARFAHVPLTTMRQPDKELGEKAIDLLLDRIEGKLPSGPVTIPLAAKLVVRESCGPPLSRA